MNFSKILRLSCLTLVLLIICQVGNAQKLKVAVEKINAFTQWATSPKVVVVSGDFNGDGKNDMALVRQMSGWATVPMAFSNGDGKTDFSFFSQNSAWPTAPLAISNGNGTFTHVKK